ncbi:hypothetical protein CSC04_3643 [Enterobacter roggenkampii]|nr:hypothetical protein CSC04_3643 [Enterobacter roggenkampii]
MVHMAGRENAGFFDPSTFYQALKEYSPLHLIWHISCKITFKESFVSC